MKLNFKREWLLFLLFLYLIFLISQLNPRKTEWEKKEIELPPQEKKEITRFTKEFSFAETRGDKMIFEIFAKEVISQKETILFLKDVNLTFHLKEGKVSINCNEVKFDLEKKDAEISGKIFAKFPNGLNLGTETFYYKHGLGVLESPISLNISYENYVGSCSALELNIINGNFAINSLKLESKESFFYFPNFKGNANTLKFYSKGQSYLIFKENIFTLKDLKLEFSEKDAIIDSKCFEGNFILEKSYIFTSEEFYGEFARDNFIPKIFKYSNNLKILDYEENFELKAREGILYFKEGKPDVFNLSGEVLVERGYDSLNCNFINAYFKEGKVDNVSFGDYIIFCYGGWYINSDSMHYLPSENVLFLGGDIYLSKGYKKIKTKWMKVLEEGKKMFFGGGFEMEEREIKLRGKEGDYEEKFEKLNLRRDVVVWSKEYTLKADNLEVIKDQVRAFGNASLKGWNEERNFLLMAKEIYIDQREETLKALFSVSFQWENYKMEGYFLQIYRKDEKPEKFVFSDQVKFFTLDKKQRGSGDFLEFYAEGNFLILEGCPAKLEDEKEGKVEAGLLFILKEPPQVYIFDEKGGIIFYKRAVKAD